MLSLFDDYPIHQTPEPVAQPGTSDPNFYDRFFFNGYDRDGSVFFGAALGVYPNRWVMDAAFSVVVDGRQYALHASKLLPSDRAALTVGPLTVEIVEPMRTFRIFVQDAERQLHASLTFRARTAAVEEPRNVMHTGHKLMLDTTRLTQFGRWAGSIRVDNHEIEVRPEDTYGCRDRSWGIRPVGERGGGPAIQAPQFFWLWSPVHFEDVCTHFDVNEDGTGRPSNTNGSIVPVVEGADLDPLDTTDIETMHQVSHDVTWQSGTRRASRAVITLSPWQRQDETIELEPILTFQMLGLGYLHPEWGHGMWKGDLAVMRDEWVLSELDPEDPRHLHVQQLCQATWGQRHGVGVLEQLVIGEHEPSGFTGLFDGAA